MPTSQEKKRKLRNAEYYDFQGVLDSLYAKSSRSEIFTDLTRIIIREENIRLAYRNLKKNPGSKTAGTDGRTIRYLERLNDKELIGLVRKKIAYYQPQKIKRVEIPKDNGKSRPLGIPTITDRLVQQCVMQVLEPICEAKFYKHSYGFRPLRSAENAIHRFLHLTNRHNFTYVVDIDIKGFFDNINHGKLLKQIWTLGIRDKKLIKIISVMLKAEVAGIGFSSKGTPQGGIISPLLSNIVLNELDWWIAGQWEYFPTRHTYTNCHQYEALRKTRMKECFILRYADDFKLFCKDHNTAKKLFEGTKLWLRDRLGLEISPEKSRIVNLKKQYSEFLGFKFKLRKKGNKFVIRGHVRDKSVEKIITKAKSLIKEIQHAPNKYPAICHYNAFVMGIHNYYNKASRVSMDFKKISYQLNICMINRLTLKKKGFVPDYIKKYYGASRQLRFVDNIAVVPIGYVQNAVSRPFYNSSNVYTEEGRRHIHEKLQCVNQNVLRYLMQNPVRSATIEYNDNRLSLYCGQQGKCAVTKEELKIGQMHCHHIQPKAKGGDDRYQNLAFVTEAVHKIIHAKSDETIRILLREIDVSPGVMRKINKYRLLAGNDEISAIGC